MKKIAIFLLIVIIIIGLFYSINISQTINVKDYIKDKFPSIFSFYLSSLEELDQYEKEFIDLLRKLPGEEREYYAKEVYKNGFSLELLERLKKGGIFEKPVLDWDKVKEKYETIKEKPIESLPSIIKRIEPSTVIVFTYNRKGEFLHLGSGFFISQNGDIITNYHVLQGASTAEIKTSDGKTHPIAYIVADDEQSDIICLSVDIPSQYVYPLSLSATLPEVGERIIVYGSPLGLEKTVSDGIVSAIREVPAYGKVIQITAPVSPGSSGSPVLNMKGEVIGVATFQMIEGQNLNFAIPSERIVNLNLMEEKEIYVAEELFEQESKEKKDSDHAYEAYNQALYFIDKEEYEKALSYLQIVIKIEPFNAYAYSDIGFCYGELGAYTKAIEAYKQVLNIDPENVNAYYNLGVSYSELDYNNKAIEVYKQAIRIDPDCFEAYSNLGSIYKELSYYTKAIEVYKQAIRINPEDVGTHTNLGVAYFGLDYYTKAIEAFKRAIRIDPEYVIAHYDLGYAYSLFGDKKSALNEYKILKDLDVDLANKLFDLIY